MRRHRVIDHRVQLVLGHEAGREREHAQALLAHADVGGVEVGLHVSDRNLRAAQRTAGVRAAREDDVGAALDELDDVLALRRP